MEDPDGFVDLRRENDEFGPGIDVIYGIRSDRGPRGGKTKIQSIRFDSRMWTAKGARDWLAEHDLAPIRFEEAASKGSLRKNPDRRDQRVLDALSRHAELVRGNWRENPQRYLDRSDYPGVFGDPDSDSLPFADDPHPLAPGDTESVEEVMLSEELDKLLQIRDEYDAVTQEARRRLEGIAPERARVKSRTKTPFSIINKLRRKRLEGPKGLTDISGTMLVVPDYDALEDVREKVEGGALGEVLEVEDHYELPGPYRAVHYIAEVMDRPVEVQLKTARQATLAGAAHTPYKRGTIDEREMERIGRLAHAADEGNEQAAEEVDRLLMDDEALQTRLDTSIRSNPSDVPGWKAALAGAGFMGLLYLASQSNRETA